MGDVSDMRHRLLHYLETRAINLWFGQSPMSRRLLIHRFPALLSSFSWTLCSQPQCCKNHERCGHKWHRQVWDPQSCPSGNVKLRTEYCRRLFVSRLCNFEKVSRFGFLERIQKPFVKDEQGRLLVLLYDLSEGTVTSRNASSTNNSGSLTYLTERKLRMAAIPSAQAIYVLPLPVAPKSMTLCRSDM